MPHATRCGDPCTWRKDAAQGSCLQNDDFIRILAHLATRGRNLAHLGRLLPNRRIYVVAPFSLLYKVPGGDQVDGLPPAASTGARVTYRPTPLIHCQRSRVLAWLVLEMCLFVLNGPLGNDRYMYNLYFPTGASLSMDFGRSWCRLKPRNE